MAGEFGTVLRRLRKRAGLTQEEVEGRSGIGVRTIRDLENGARSNPRMDTVRRLADGLGLGSEERQRLLDAAVRGRRSGIADTADAPEPGTGTGLTPEPGTGARPEESGAAPTAPPTVPPSTPASTPSAAPSAAPRRPGSAARDALADAAGQLAEAVAARWRREEEHRGIHDPYPLPVRWTAADARLTDHWANIRCLPPGSTGEPLDLSGQVEVIADIYRTIPSGRLVVLGRSGSGKTVLTLRFVLDHLETRTPDEPVPVVFSIGAWNPTAVTLREWLAERLTRDHPGTAARGPGGVSLAEGLVDSGHVLPVLDGFDEMADGLRRPALEALNRTTLPLVLTSRPAEYAAAVGETDVLTAAAPVELADLTLPDLDHYLRRTTVRPDPADPSAGLWDAVLKRLGAPEPEPSAVRLAAVLSTPLMVSLVRTVYSDPRGPDPAELLDAGRFRSEKGLEEHLLDSFLPTVYRPRPGVEQPDPERARRWLGYLAHHLTERGTPDLAWWRLDTALGGTPRTLVTALVTGVVIGLVDASVAAAVHGVLVGALLDGAVVGLVAGIAFGLVNWFTYTVRGKEVAPSAVRFRIRGGTSETTFWTAGPRLVIGMLGGGLFGFVYAFVTSVLYTYDRNGGSGGLAAAVRPGLVDGTAFGLVFSAGTGVAFALLGRLETPLDIRSAVSPRGVLDADRRTATVRLAVWTAVFATVIGVGTEIAVELLQGYPGRLALNNTNSLTTGVISGLGGALGYLLSLTAWGQWCLLTRLWLPLTGRLPWALVGFLDDAYRRGVLRQAGAVHQFRHARLQSHLAQAYRGRQG
ncbi:helix-turn-helix domain-containing protein [Streptomyces sp. NPDC093085]|uniref:helix-turn-helix domain-containing protein n=1 Tax=Streptomyces sp. NPDC093085 TaxID=3155068 RepID=UPI00343B83E9